VCVYVCVPPHRTVASAAEDPPEERTAAV